MKNIIKNIINFIFIIFPIKNNKIVFQSGRKKVDCGPYNVYKEIKKNNDDFKCVWIVEKGTDVSNLDKNDYCFYPSIKSYYHLATTHYFIRSQSFSSPIKKKKKQVYIQMWHGAGAFKKCGYDCSNDTTYRVPMDHVKDWDYFIATDIDNEKIMKSSTGYNKNSIVLGNSDTDILLNAKEDYINDIYNKLNIDKNKKIVLYAPTFRDNELEDPKKYKLPIKKLKDLPDDYLVLLRLHPLMDNIIKDLKLPKNFVNAGKYPNIIDLYLISNILITDYSSIVFPFALLNRPIILYPYDMAEYVKLRGGFYIDYNILPGPICYNEDELIKAITSKGLLKKYSDKMKNFNERFNSLNDGNVSKKFVELLKKGYFR